ncbi:MAG: Stf0 family sulfotransferase [Roseiarcus sp.]
MQVDSIAEKKPAPFATDERYDFDKPAPFRKSYIVASSYRSGSTYFCTELWRTGVLGAPGEYLNIASRNYRMMRRLQATTPEDYFTKLLARRTSANGVFGIKAHFHHFEPALKWYPSMLKRLSPVTFIYIERRDKLAQAISMARAMQTDRWLPRIEKGPSPPLKYDPELIAKCLEEVDLQDASWLQWFASNDVTPHHLIYEDLLADPAGAIRSIVELLGAQNDERTEVRVPPADKQGDETNREWKKRFERETLSPGDGRVADVGGAEGVVGGAEGMVAGGAEAKTSTAGGHFFDRYDGLVRTLAGKTNSATGFIDMIRLRRRYEAIIGQNRALLRGARVLDLASSEGFWSLAALDAGAAHVVGIETSRGLVETAEKNFAECSVRPDSYKFIQSNISAVLRTLNPGRFDVILCKGFFERCQVVEFFWHLSRLQPKHVVLDTAIGRGDDAMARFSTTTGRKGAIMLTPTHKLIAFLCASEFQWRLIDWRSLGFDDWTGVHDYARDSHRTYVLDRLP